MANLLSTSPYLAPQRFSFARPGRSPVSLSLSRWPWVLACLLLSLLQPTTSQAQILDDTTKTLYGPKTTLVLREADLLRENEKGVMVDTTLTGIQQPRNWAHDSTYQQDLGNLGTASRPLLWQFNTNIGARLGRNVFDRYARDATTIPYYDSRSPYTFFRYIQSGNGEQVFELSYSRSLGKNTSMGFAYERIASNNQYAANRRQGLVEHNNVLIYARHQSKDERYYIMGNFNTSRHEAVEQGGVRRQSNNRDINDLFDFTRAVVRLPGASGGLGATNRDSRDQVHFTQIYQLLGRGLTAFHTFDWRRQTNKYTDTKQPDSNVDSLRFYPFNRYNLTTTNDRAEYRQLENTAGVLGHSSTVDYRLYARARYYNLTNYTLDSLAVLIDTFSQGGIKNTQLFVGGTANFQYKIFAIQTAGEYLPSLGSSNNNTLGEYWFRASARVGPLSGEVASSSYAPTLTQQRFFGTHYNWNNNFSNTTVTQFTGRVNQTLGNQHLEASAALVYIDNLVYYNQNAVPAQLQAAKQLLIVSARHRFHYGRIYTDNEATYTSGGDGEGLRIPALVANSKLYYQGTVFKNVLFGQVGAEVYYQSRFRGYDYSPSTQQFFIQDHFTIRNYALADVFLNADIRTVSVFLKMAYINQGLGAKGYFASPFYPGLPRRFQFGIRWQFFN